MSAKENHIVHGVLKARILKWFAIPFSSGPHSVRPLHHDPSKERRLCRCRRAKWSYSMFKIRRGDFVQGKEQWLCFAGAAVKRYPTSKVRETQVRW